jgi:Domain of Unknown Function with PDB structure (DUF3857)
MKTILLGVLLLVGFTVGAAEDFLRNLPDINFLNQLTREKYKQFDAIIILKEQALTVHPSSSYTYRGIDFYAPKMGKTVITIAKVLNEAGVKKYGSFEYRYIEFYGDELRNGFTARARVLKSDGSIWVMDEDEVQIIVSRRTKDGTPIERKAMFTIPDLAPGDVVQTEYTFVDVLASSISGLFYYNDTDPIIFSNVALTLPAEDDVRVFSFPPERVGEPKASQLSNDLGVGQTLFWGLKNLSRIPVEPYAPTFSDQSMITAFVVDRKKFNGTREITDWNSIGKKFYEDYINDGDISDGQIAELGFPPVNPHVTAETVDSLYTAIRNMISLRPYNSLYPVGDIDDLYEAKNGDASDCAYLMYSVARHWHVPATVAWVRDRRDGKYEMDVPATRWFDRLAVIVTVDGPGKLYDFDRSIPARYDMPWYLYPCRVVEISSAGVLHKTFYETTNAGDHYLDERHTVGIDPGGSMTDTVDLRMRGFEAEDLREQFYDMEETDIDTHIRTMATSYCLERVDSVNHNDLLHQEEMQLHFAGRSTCKAEQVESFLTVRVKDHVLHTFKDRIAAPVRLSDVILDEPFAMHLEWVITVPDGYVPADSLLARTFAAPARISGQISRTFEKGHLTIAARASFPESLIPLAQYKGLMQFMESMETEIERDVTLKKM